ncbi:MAG: T9SS type A sorting domain-containing protein [Bacteroidota bacterium]
MKKLFTIGLSILSFGIGYSQNAPINFETGGQGAGWTWTTFENGSNPALEVVNNPSALAPNTSTKVAKFTALQTGQPWAGCESLKGSDIGTFNLTASNCIVKIMVYKSVISDVGIKFATDSGASSGEIKVANTKINEWEELTFNFSGKIGEPSSTNISQIIIFPDFNLAGRTSNVIAYFDNITFSAGSALPEPTTAPDAPTKPAADVISLFSNTYTNVPIDTWRTSWSAATLTDMQVASNDVKKYSGLDFVGVEMVQNRLNVTAMNFFEFDLWTPNVTSFRVKLVDFGADGAFGGGDDKEHELAVTPTLNGWNHFAIPMENFIGLTTKSNIAQIIFGGTPAGTSIVYLDNILFSKATVVAEPTVAAPTPTKAAADVISMFSNAYTNVPVETWRTSWSAATLTDIQIASNDVKKYTALDFVGVETGANQINASTMDSFEFDFWTPNSTTLKFKLVDFGPNGTFDGGDDKEHEVTITPTVNEWNHVSVALSSLTGLTTKSNIAQLIFASVPSGISVLYIDNVLFSKVPQSSVAKVELNNVGIYPNPATNMLSVTSTNNIQVLTIYNALGQAVLTAYPNAAHSNVDISALPMGLYTIKATINGAETFNKLIKE